MLQWSVTIGILVGFVMAVAIARRRGRIAPRQARRYHWVILVMGICMCAAGLSSLFFMDQGKQVTRPMTWFNLGAGACLILVWWWTIERRPSRSEAEVNYAIEPTCCGRCDYDLTGNVSGTCPECGWKIPPTPMCLDAPHWGLFWRKWEIGYLANPRKTLYPMFVAVPVATVIGLLPLLLWPTASWPAILIALVFVSLAGLGAINIYRVCSYMGRIKGRSRPPS